MLFLPCTLIYIGGDESPFLLDECYCVLPIQDKVHQVRPRFWRGTKASSAEPTLYLNTIMTIAQGHHQILMCKNTKIASSSEQVACLICQNFSFSIGLNTTSRRTTGASNVSLCGGNEFKWPSSGILTNACSSCGSSLWIGKSCLSIMGLNLAWKPSESLSSGWQITSA